MSFADPSTPPQNLSAEQSVLASMLLDNRRIDEAAAIVKAEQFYAERHQVLYTEILRMWESQTGGIDAVTLADSLTARKLIEDAGGARYLFELLDAVPHAAHVAYYAKIVHEHWLERQALAVGTDLVRQMREGSKERSEIIAEASDQLDAVIESGLGQGPRPIASSVLDWIANRAAGKPSQTYIATGFAGWDQTTGGIPAGRVTTIAARTSHGKTSLLQALGQRIAESGAKVLMVSYEMPEPELVSRFVSVLSRVHLTPIQRGQLEPADNFAVVEAANQLAALPITIDDSGPEETTLYATIRMAARRHGIQVAIIDYLQLIDPSDRKLPREQQVAGISRGLTRLAQKTGVAIVLAAQLNRDVEKRENKRPKLSDLRESGSIEQDASMVVLMHRPNKDSGSLEAADDHAVVEIAKNRSGPTGSFNLHWNCHCAEFHDDRLRGCPI